MDRWKQIDKLLEDALEHRPEERADFLGQACPTDLVLKREVESLLAAHDQAGSFIESSPAEAAAAMLAGSSKALTKRGAEDLAESIFGRQIGSYRILSLLGEGGMGAVYLAEDTKLERKVAIKLLTGAFSADQVSRKRLIREAQAAAKLDHPGICPVYEVGFCEPDSFIVMQYIDGETLATRIQRESLGLGQSLDFAAQIAGALAEAHSKGVIHRDIKPQNVLINTRGQAKVLDFGLAKIAQHGESRDERAIADSLSSTPGLILGTVPYMSPEQLRGEPLDVRTDIFSFGALLYEMLSGTQPFVSDSSAETIVAILTREPPLLSEYGAEIPEELQHIVSRCLEKDRSQRYQTMLEVATELEDLLRKNAQPDSEALPARRVAERRGAKNTDRRLRRQGIFAHWRLLITITLIITALAAVGYEWVAQRAAAPGSLTLSKARPARTSIRSLAVLPFKPLSEEGRDEYLELGLADALIGKLSSLRHIVVRPTSAVRKYTALQQDPVAAGRELKVEAVLDGSMQKLGDRVRVTARLVRVEDGSALWSERFDEGIKDVLILLDAMSERVATALTPTLTGDEKKLLAKHYTDNADAYRAYLMGRYSWNKRTSEGLSKGVRYFQQAIDIQPDYALAYAGLADCYMSLYGYCFKPAGEVVPLAKASATRALELDDGLSEAHTSRACTLFLDDRNWPAAESEFLRAIDLNPNYATARHWYSVYLGSLGRLNEALVEMGRAQEIDPLSPSINTDLGELLYFSRQYDRAIEQIQKTLDMQPDFLQAYWALGNVYERRQMYDQSIAAYERALELSGLGNLGAALRKHYLVSGYTGAMRMMLDERKTQARRDLSLSHSIGRYYAALGDRDLAFEWLEKAYQSRNPWLINMGVEPQLDSLRSDPRFASLLRRMRIPQS